MCVRIGRREPWEILPQTAMDLPMTTCARSSRLGLLGGECGEHGYALCVTCKETTSPYNPLTISTMPAYVASH